MSRGKIWLIGVTALFLLLAFLFFKDERLGDHSDFALRPYRPANSEQIVAAWEEVSALVDEKAWGTEPHQIHNKARGRELIWSDDGTIAKANEAALAAALRADQKGAFGFPSRGPS